MKKIIFFGIFVYCIGLTSHAQFYVTPSNDPVQLVNDFILTGVSASNVVYTGGLNTLGSFTDGSLTNLGIDNGIAMTTGSFDTAVNVSVGDTVGAFANYFNNFPGDSLLNTLIAPWQTYDASILEFDLIPVGNVLEFQYVFASEEYPEYVNSSYNDVFGFFISGPDPTGGNYINYNIALLPDDSLPVAINNVNAGLNASYFVDNLALNGQTIVYDGFTTVLTAQVFVVPGQTYHLKMALADAGDGFFDSGIFLKAQSMKSYFFSNIAETESNIANVYPNPIQENSILNINMQHSGKAIVTVSDRSGRVINQNEINISQPGNYNLAIGQMLSNYPSGMYFISIQTPEKVSKLRVVK